MSTYPASAGRAGRLGFAVWRARKRYGKPGTGDFGRRRTASGSTPLSAVRIKYFSRHQGTAGTARRKRSRRMSQNGCKWSPPDLPGNLRCPCPSPWENRRRSWRKHPSGPDAARAHPAISSSQRCLRPRRLSNSALIHFGKAGIYQSGWLLFLSLHILGSVGKRGTRLNAFTCSARSWQRRPHLRWRIR